MIEALRFLLLAWRGYWIAKESGKVSYSAVLTFDVPRVCLIVATDRNAWRVSQFAMEHFQKHD